MDWFITLFENFLFHWKSDSLNLSVERVDSIVASRTFVLASVSNELQPKRRVLIKIGSQRFRKLLSIFTRVLRRVRISIIYMGQWRRKCAVDSISKLQLQNGFKESWKLCLNLCSRKWLKPSRSLVINLIPLGLWQLKRLLADGHHVLQLRVHARWNLAELNFFKSWMPTNDNEWQRIVQRLLKKWQWVTKIHNEWQQMTMSNSDWQWVVQRMKTTESKYT